MEVASLRKMGPLYQLAPSYIKLLAAVCYLYNVSYSQLDVLTRSLHWLMPKLPPDDLLHTEEAHSSPNPEVYRVVADREESVAITLEITEMKVHGKSKLALR